MSSCEETLIQIAEQMQDNKLDVSNPRYKAWLDQKKAHDTSKEKQAQWDQCKNHLHCYGHYDGYRGTVDYLRSDQRDWINCISDLTRTHHDDACVRDAGPDWYQLGYTTRGCGWRLHKGFCARNDNAVKRDLGDLGGRPAISPDPGPFQMSPVPNVSCCQDINFSNLSADKIKFNAVTQTCEKTESIPDSLPDSSEGASQDSSSEYIVFIIILICSICLTIIVLSLALSDDVETGTPLGYPGYYGIPLNDTGYYGASVSYGAPFNSTNSF